MSFAIFSFHVFVCIQYQAIIVLILCLEIIIALNISNWKCTRQHTTIQKKRHTIPNAVDAFLTSVCERATSMPVFVRVLYISICVHAHNSNISLGCTRTNHSLTTFCWQQAIHADNLICNFFPHSHNAQQTTIHNIYRTYRIYLIKKKKILYRKERPFFYSIYLYTLE